MVRNRFFQAEAIKATAILIIYSSWDAVKPTGSPRFHFYYWSIPLLLGNTWDFQRAIACTKLDAEVVTCGRNLRVKSWQDIFQTCFDCLSHDLTRSFFQYNFCLAFHGISHFPYFIISCHNTTCGMVSARHTTDTAFSFFICSFSYHLAGSYYCHVSIALKLTAPWILENPSFSLIFLSPSCTLYF